MPVTRGQNLRSQARTSPYKEAGAGGIDSQARYHDKPRDAARGGSESPTTDTRMVDDSTSYLETTGIIVAKESRYGLLYNGLGMNVVELDPMKDYEMAIEPDCGMKLAPQGHIKALDKRVATAVAAGQANKSDIAEEFSKKLVRVLESNTFANKRVIWRLEFEGERYGLNCPQMKHREFCAKLGIESFEKLKLGGTQQPKEDIARVSQRQVQQGNNAVPEGQGKENPSTAAPVKPQQKQNPTSQPPLPTPSSSPEPSVEQHRAQRRSSSVVPSVESPAPTTTDANQAPTKLYTPCVDGKEYHHIATHLPYKYQKKRDDTPCIVQVGDTLEFRLWTWGDVQRLRAKPCAAMEEFDEQDEGGSAEEWQFHKPDEAALAVVENAGGFRKIPHTVHAMLTRWNKHEDTFTNSVLVSVDDTTVWKEILEARKKKNYTYEGPLRCSVSEFTKKGGKYAAAMEKLQRDTEAGAKFFEYKSALNGKKKSRATGRAREREWTPVDAVEAIERLERHCAGLLERVVVLEGKISSPVRGEEKF
ncbi:hypothetical protein BKA63DRAFT_497697 [Paraphoma chrysanthemicola]|nr:hypothetical protein BKA63DRAFT_497885 [Paraphoma chrysanthemicola]KAH7061852.1 hypothetical protein BKA63DRAFT_497697 [Paraphoma chrysanthemicola]